MRRKCNNKYYKGKRERKNLQIQLPYLLAFLTFINFQIFLFLSTKNVLSTTKATRLLAGSGLSLHLSLLSFLVLPLSDYLKNSQFISCFFGFFWYFLNMCKSRCNFASRPLDIKLQRISVFSP